MSDQMTVPSDTPGADRGRDRLVLLSVIGLVIVAVIAAGLMLVGSDDSAEQTSIQTAGEIFLQPAAAPGPDAFFDDVDELVPGGEAGLDSDELQPATADADDTEDVDAVSTTATSGTTPGLYGGSRDDAVCDPSAIVSFLEANADKAAAWASVHGITVDQIADYVAALTPVRLLVDTRVTNHGFRDGVANGFQAVLQAGTSVLVDNTGVPRARCACGNPLIEPVAQSGTATFTGDAWDGFDANDTAVVTAGAPVDGLVLRDLDGDGDEAFERPVGSDGSRDIESARISDVGAATSTAPTTAPATTTPPTTVPATTTSTTSAPSTTTTELLRPVDVTQSGTVSASSIFSGDFAAGLAVDGSAGSSWFSAGGGGATFTWSAPEAMPIEEVVIVGNGSHAVPDFRTGFGFEAVTIEYVLDGAVVASSAHGMGGTPDPTVIDTPGGVVADAIRLVFTGGEDPTCGGFAELNVVALR